MEKVIYLAAQYLAATANSLLEHQSDDSQANLAFNTQEARLETRSLDNDGSFLSFNYKTFSLELHHPVNLLKEINLNGKTHLEVLTWLSDVLPTTPEKPFAFEVNYEIPFNIDNNYIYQNVATEQLLELREKAQAILTGFLDKNELKSEVRVWPHHFDTGAFVVLNSDSGLSMGLGLAVPDSLSDDFYFYASAYLGEGAVDTDKFEKLSAGRWINDGFKGAILSASGVTVTDGIAFFEEVLNFYKK